MAVWTIPSKQVHINMCPIFIEFGDTSVGMLSTNSLTKGCIYWLCK
jgi:hypothetical protein